MYRIMLVRSKKCNCQSLYQFLSADNDGVTEPVEIGSKEQLDSVVESMLNDGYAKSDFIIVRVIDYEISAGPYSDDQDNEGEEIGG